MVGDDCGWEDGTDEGTTLVSGSDESVDAEVDKVGKAGSGSSAHICSGGSRPGISTFNEGTINEDDAELI